jgi:FHA domain-containing protein
MFVCPKGHQSQAGDYCDECGAAISADRSHSSARTVAAPPVPATSGSGSPCPECDAPQAGRFCEVCGYDFVIAKLGGGRTGLGTGSIPRQPSQTGAASAQSSGTAPDPASAGAAGSATDGAGSPPTASTPDATGPGNATVSTTAAGSVSAGPGSAAGPVAGKPADGNGSAPGVSSAVPTLPNTASIHAAGTHAGRAVPDGGPLPQRTPPDVNGSTSWVLTVDADAAYHARMQAQAEPDAEPIALPAFVPPRRFVLTGAQALIGRQSRSRGIAPEIDLSGPPSDSAVSHAHALLLAGPDGSWAVVDLESANGTYVNDDPDPIPPNAPCQLADGDRIHVGAWTTITLAPALTEPNVPP